MKTTLLYGALIALANSLITLVFFFLGYHSDAAKMASLGKVASLIPILVSIVGIVIGTRARRSEVPAGEPFNYGRAFSTGLLIGVFASLFGAIFYLIYITAINPGFSDVISEMQATALRAKGIPEQQIETAQKFGAFFMKPVVQFGFAVVGGAIEAALIALITGACLRRNAQQIPNQPPAFSA